MRILTLLTAAFIFFGTPVFAQDMDYVRSYEKLSEINDYNPANSGRHAKSADILSDRVLDRSNKVVGEVKDVILDRNGSIAYLTIDFNRLNLGQDVLTVNYRQLGMRPVSNGYKMNYSDDQIVDIFPSLLASIETAAGEGDRQQSVTKIQGRTVRATDGRTIGKVQDILFDDVGGRAELILVNMSARSVRNKPVAIPYFEGRENNGYVEISNGLADAMAEYAQNN